MHQRTLYSAVDTWLAKFPVPLHFLYRPKTRRGEITKVHPMDGKKYPDSNCADILPTKVERIIQHRLERLPNGFGISAARNNFINELKSNSRSTSEPSAPHDAVIYNS